MIYFIGAYDDNSNLVAIKIGTTSNSIARRISTIQTSNYMLLALISVKEGSSIEERKLHDRFWRDRLRGEWFRPSKRLVEEATKWKESTVATLLAAGDDMLGVGSRLPETTKRAMKDVAAKFGITPAQIMDQALKRELLRLMETSPEPSVGCADG